MFDLIRSDWSDVVFPGLAGVGENVGDLLVLETDEGRHDAVEILAVHFDGTLEAMDDDFRRDTGITGEPVGAVDGWERTFDSVAVRAVAGDTGEVEDGFASGVDFRVDWEFASDFSFGSAGSV